MGVVERNIWDGYLRHRNACMGGGGRGWEPGSPTREKDLLYS